MWLCSAAVGTGVMYVALLCCSRYRRQVCGLAVPAVCTGGMCVAPLCLQYLQEVYVWLGSACSRYRRYVCGSALLQ